MSMIRRKTADRGYGATHQRLRAQWAPLVASGGVSCSRCRKPIKPGQAWHLDHKDNRKGYRGPSHEGCNVGAPHKGANPKPRKVSTW